MTLALWFHFIAVFASILPLAFGYPRPPVLPALKDWVPLVAISTASFINQICLNRGFQLEVAAKASAMNYTQVCTDILHAQLKHCMLLKSCVISLQLHDAHYKAQVLRCSVS